MTKCSAVSSFISATLDAEGRILHLIETHRLSFGELNCAVSPRAKAIAAAFAAKFDSRVSTAILHEMWEKWVFIAATAAATCLMRATVGDIISAGAVDLTRRLFDECSAIATAHGFEPIEAIRASWRPGGTAALIWLNWARVGVAQRRGSLLAQNPRNQRHADQLRQAAGLHFVH